MGWETNRRTRPILLDHFYDAVTSIDSITGTSECRINSSFTFEDMRDFHTDGALWEAEAARGAHDDTVIAGGIAHIVCWRLQGGELEPLADRRHRRQQEALRLARTEGAVVVDYRNTDSTAQEQNSQQILTAEERIQEEEDDDAHLFYDPEGRAYGGTLY
jgi:hypothetical protein